MTRDTKQMDLWSNSEREEGQLSEEDYIILSIQPEPYSRIVSGAKKFEYRRNFRDRATVAFVYVTAPVAQIAGVMGLAEPIRDSPTEIAALAERQMEGNGAPVLRYLTGASSPCAIPIMWFKSIEPLPAKNLRERYNFFPPQYFVSLARNRDLLAHLIKVAGITDIRRPNFSDTAYR